MNKKEFNVAISATDNNAKNITGVIQYDTGNIININMLEGDKVLDFRGYSSVVVSVLLPDGTVYTDMQGDYLDVINAQAGMVCFTLSPNCVAQVGMHYITVSIYGSGHKITMARLNYMVMAADQADNNAVVEDSNFPVMQKMLSRLSEIESQETFRSAAEQIRAENENDRKNESTGIYADTKALLTQMNAVVAQCQNWYNYINSVIATANPDLSQMATKTSLQNIDCGAFGDSNVQTVKIKRGLSSALPTLAEGQMGYATDSKALYIGTSTGNVQLNAVPSIKTYAAANTAPTDTTLLWIDTANNNAIKYFDGSVWQIANTAVFA